MSRRKISTILLTLSVAAMVGFREATGLAPPPPTLGNEEVVWLAPEREGDPGLFVVLEAPEPVITDPGHAHAASRRPGLLERLVDRIRRWR